MNYYYLLLVSFYSLSANWAETTLSKLSLYEKIGQLFVVAAISDYEYYHETRASTPLISPYKMDQTHIERLITTYHIGGLIYLHKSTTAKQHALTQHYQTLSKLPLLICQDFEWGLSMRLTDGLRFPRNMTLGALQNDQLIFQLGKEIGRQCRALGVHMNLAPVVDINNNHLNPVINDRSFGEDKQRVARLGSLMAQGLKDSQVLACAKHFPGHGDTSFDSHLSLPLIPHTKKRFMDLELYPFKHLIAQNIPAIMTAHLAVPAFEEDTSCPSSLSYTIVTELLQHTLGYHGLIITDGLGMGALTNNYASGEIELKALLAGNDILLCPLDVPKAVELIKQALEEGSLTEQELNRRVLKILKAKESIGLHIKTTPSNEPLIMPEALELKKKLYQQAITLVKDDNNLPIAITTPVIQIGKADEFVHYFSEVYQLSTRPSLEELNLLNLDHHETVIVSIAGMNKYAKDNFGITSKTLALLKRLQKNHTVILVLFGNPYSLKNFENESTILVAYEDDPDAQQAAAQVLLGNLAPQGKLPVTASEQFNVGCGITKKAI